MQAQKVIIKGRLDFGNDKSFEKVLALIQHRMNNFYKNDTLINVEEMFMQETHSFVVPRLVTQAMQKTWNNTISAIEYIAQFAVAGHFYIFMSENGNIIKKKFIEPINEKQAVQAFQNGKSYADDPETHDKAIKYLDDAISIYDKHAMAYEKRGYVKYLLKQYDGALIDFNKSIAVDDQNPEPYVGKAVILNLQDNRREAITLLDEALKLCFPLQPIYWKIRRIKGHLLVKEQEYTAAAQEFKFFLNKKFETENPNYAWVRTIMWDYAHVLIQLHQLEDAHKWLNLIEETPCTGKTISEKEFYEVRANLRKDLGLKTWQSDATKLKSLDVTNIGPAMKLVAG
jgi:tetratricopeptide (TPR) repeat protein